MSHQHSPCLSLQRTGIVRHSLWKAGTVFLCPLEHIVLSSSSELSVSSCLSSSMLPFSMKVATCIAHQSCSLSFGLPHNNQAMPLRDAVIEKLESWLEEHVILDGLPTFRHQRNTLFQACAANLAAQQV